MLPIRAKSMDTCAERMLIVSGARMTSFRTCPFSIVIQPGQGFLNRSTAVAGGDRNGDWCWPVFSGITTRNTSSTSQRDLVSIVAHKSNSACSHSMAAGGIAGGGSGIRTHGGVNLTGFQDRRLRPLGHPSSTAYFTVTGPPRTIPPRLRRGAGVADQDCLLSSCLG